MGKSDAKEPVRDTATLSSNLSELDNLLAELSSSEFVSDQQPANGMTLLLILLFFYSLM